MNATQNGIGKRTRKKVVTSSLFLSSFYQPHHPHSSIFLYQQPNVIEGGIGGRERANGRAGCLRIRLPFRVLRQLSLPLQCLLLRESERTREKWRERDDLQVSVCTCCVCIFCACVCMGASNPEDTKHGRQGFS